MTMNVKAKLTLDTAGFDGPMQKSGEVATATSRAQEKAAKQAAQAQATAAKFAADEVTSHSLRVVIARKLEAAASQEMSAAHKAAQSGYLSEADGARVEAAALQRLTEAKLKTAEASRVQAEASHKGLLAVREHIEGLSIGGAAGENILGIGAALGVAEVANKLREAVAASLEFGESIQRASEKTGLEVGTLSTLHYAAAVTGGDFESMTSAVAKMDKTIGTATEGNAKSIAFLKSLGLNASDLAGRTDGAEIAFRKFAEKLADTENPIRRVELATGLLGKAGAEQIPMLIQLGEGWEFYQKSATDAGMMLDQKTASQLAGTKKRLEDLQQSIQGAGLAFTIGFIPGFNQMLSVISGGESQLQAMRDFGGLVAKGLNAAALAAYSAAAGINFLMGAYEGGSLTKAGTNSLARAHSFDTKAEQFRDLLAGKSVPGASTTVEPPLPKPTGAGFGGVGDLSGAANKAAEARLHAMEAELNELKLQGPLTIKWEYQFWADRLTAFKAGSSEYDTVVAKAAELSVQISRQAHEKLERFREQQLRVPSKSEGDEIAARGMQAIQRWRAKDFGVDQQDRIDSNQLSLQQAHNQALNEEAQLAEKAGRSMTQNAAAIELAAIHAREFASEMMSLEGIRNTRALTAGSDPSKENNKALAEAQAAIAEAQSKRQIEMLHDNDSINGRDSSGLVGATDALRDFVNATRDSAAGMRSFVDKTLNGINSQLVTAISTRGSQRDGFANFGAGVFRDVAGGALSKVEGSVLGAFGLGGGKKPTGAKGNPLHVMVDNPTGTNSAQPIPWLGNIGGSSSSAGKSSGGGGIVSSILGSLLGKGSSGGGSSAGGGGSDSGGDDSSSLGDMLAGIVPFLPGFADGGAIAPNTWAMVGERGPEPFFSGGGGTVIPNHKMADAFGGGGGDTHFHVDARGSNDPAAVEAAVQRGIRAAAPHIAAMGVRASAEKRMRGPSSKRG